MFSWPKRKCNCSPSYNTHIWALNLKLIPVTGSQPAGDSHMPGVRLPLLSTWPTQLKFLHIRPDRTEEPLGIATSSILQDSNSSSYPKNRTEWCINEKCTKHESRGVTSKGAKKCHVTTKHVMATYIYYRGWCSLYVTAFTPKKRGLWVWLNTTLTHVGNILPSRPLAQLLWSANHCTKQPK